MAEGEQIGMPDVTEPVNGQVLQGWSDGKMFVKGSTTMGTQDITYTAVWNYVTVTIQFGNWSQAIKYSYDEPFEAPFNTQMKDPDTNEDGTITCYRFKNWNTMEDGSGIFYDPGDEVAKKPLDEYEKRYNYYYQPLYAQWEEVTMTKDMVPYYVIYEIQDESSMYRSSVTEMYGKLGEKTQVPDEMKHYTAGILNKDYEFIPGKTEQQIIKTGEEANGKEFGYEGSTVVKISFKRDSYNITLDFNGGKYNGKDSMSAEVLYDGDISHVLDTNIIPTKDKCEFIGWDIKIPQYMPAHDIVATAQYKETDSRAVKVEYYTENLDGKGYTLASSKTVYGTVNTKIKPEPMEFSGFVTPEVKEVEVLDDGTAVCQYQYQRKEYNLIWDAGAGQLSGEGYTQGMVKYGAPITAPELTRAGYRGSFQNVAATMPAGNTIYQAQWDAEEVMYQIIYRKQNLNGNYRVIYSKGKMELAGKILSISPAVEKEYEDQFGTGYITPVTQIVEIAGDGSTAVYVDYALKRSTLNYDLSGASVVAGTYYTPEGDYYYGKTLRLPSLKYIKRTGYQILGWYDITDPEQKLVDGTNIVMGETDVTYKLKREPITYTITYDLAEENAQNPNNPETYQSGFEFNLSGAKCENMAFAGWEWAGKGQMPDGVQILENGLVYITSEATGDLKFRAKWEEEYRVFSAALFEGSTEQYTCFYPKKQEKTITLAEITPPVREGYIFACWSKKVPKETSGYYTLPLEDNTKVSSLNFNRDFLTAEWIRVSEFSGPYTQLHVSSQRELEVAAKLLKGDYLHRAIVLEEDITISNLTEPYFDRLEYDCYIKGSYTENGEEKHHTITLEHATAPLINENVGTIDGIDILGTVNGKEEASGEDTCFGAFARKNYGAIQNCRIVGTTNSFNEIIRSRIEGSAEYFGGFAGYNYGHITNCEIHDTDIVWNDQEAAKGGRKQAYVGGITGANDARAVLFDGKMYNAAVGVLSDHIRDTTQTVYLGGFAGSSSGKIQGGILENGKIGSITTRSDVQTIGRLYVGGIAGRDEEQKQENENGYQYESTISQCQVLNTSVGSAYTAGGIIGENNFSVISENTLDGVSVYGGCEYAGHIAGIWRSTCCAAKDNYIANARTATDTGTADIAAGYAEKPDGYDGVHATVMVRANDKNTKVITGNQSVSYMKGYFVCYFDRKGAHQIFYEMKYSGKEW